MVATQRLPSLLSPLPIRLARLHFKLLVAALVGLGVGFLPFQAHWPTRFLFAWNVGVALYLVLTYAMMLRADEARIRKRAAEQDEGRVAVLVLSIVATLASLIAIVFELGGANRSLQGETIAPALLAMVIMLPSLTMWANLVALSAAGLFVSASLDVSLAAYTSNTMNVLMPGDILHGLGKSILFAVLIVIVAALNGSRVTGGAEGVGRVTTRSVVHSISAIVLADMIFGYLATQ